ncbi:TIGR00341 family protein [Falsiroseomonas bella]|uniref:TIGR00341 family protein n=1 Tax=Falsiroseomonas bella TaxID=2184016 RepID=A0A317FDA2_9PROT|nr:DUF389 domain-containing protein [Falsiroseomonas bella]PWS37070.1 TIGR00341 family protein [Falsiroseomonas bella]
MRQVMVRVRQGSGAEVLAVAAACGGANMARIDARDGRGAVELVLLSLPNSAVGPLLSELERLPDLHVTLAPQGVFALRPPPSEAPDQVTDVGARSPIEVFLGGLQSVGSWSGFLGYAAAAGVVAWIGLLTGTIYLLTAAMLIAPFAGPAMNAALATARGDGALLGRSVARYFSALLVSIAVAAALSLALGQRIATELMTETSALSSVAVLLPLVAGAAGALNLCQSERSSLVSGAATGMLVAASLAPPAAVLGMAWVIGEREMMVSAAFVLLLQLFGINLSAAAVFRLQGLTPSGARYVRGRWPVTWFAAGVSSLALAGLLAWQFADPPALQRSTRAQRAVAAVHEAVKESGAARLLEARVRFAGSEHDERPRLLVEVYAQPNRDAEREAVRQEVIRAIRSRIADRFEATPFVAVTLLDGA